MYRAAVAALCFGSSSAFVAVQPARVSSVAVQAVPRDDAAKPLAALAPAAQLAGALTLMADGGDECTEWVVQVRAGSAGKRPLCIFWEAFCKARSQVRLG